MAYLSGIYESDDIQLNGENSNDAILTSNNTWTGTNTFTQNTSFTGAMNIFSGSIIATYGSLIYLNNLSRAYTQASSDNSTAIATTAWVKNQGYTSFSGKNAMQQVTIYNNNPVSITPSFGDPETIIIVPSTTPNGSGEINVTLPVISSSNLGATFTILLGGQSIAGYYYPILIQNTYASAYMLYNNDYNNAVVISNGSTTYGNFSPLGYTFTAMDATNQTWIAKSIAWDDRMITNNNLTYTGANTYSGSNTYSGTSNFTGTATAVTQASTDNSTRIATTAYVKNNLLGNVVNYSSTLTSFYGGPNALNSSLYGSGTAFDCVCIGENSMRYSTTGYQNLFIGKYAGSQISTGYKNVCLGVGAGQNITTGTENFGLGSVSLGSCTTGNFNVGIGISSLQNANTNSQNIAIGRYCLFNCRSISGGGDSNCAIGYFGQVQLTNGSSNVSLGAYALYNNIVSSFNSAFGDNAGYGHIGSGGYNCFFGASAGSGSASNSNNTYIGALTTNTGSYSNSTCIGYGSVINASNRIILGRSTEPTYTMGGLVIPSGVTSTLDGTINFNTPPLYTNLSTPEQTQTVSGSGAFSLSFGTAKNVMVVNSTITQINLPTPSASNIGATFNIIKSGPSAKWNLTIQCGAGETFTVDGSSVNSSYIMLTHETSITVTAIGSTSGITWNLYNNMKYNVATFISSALYPVSPAWTLPGNILNVNTISIGVGSLANHTGTGYGAQTVAIGCGSLNALSGGGAANTCVGMNTLNTSASLGNYNCAFGHGAGTLYAQTGSNCTLLGASTDFNAASAFSNSTALGYGAIIRASNEIVLGRSTEDVVIPGNLSFNRSYFPFEVNTTLITAATTLATPIYGTYLVQAGAAAYSITLPLSSSVPIGSTILFRRSTTTNVTIVQNIIRQGTDVIYALNGATGLTVATAILAANVYNGRVINLNTGIWAIIP